MSTPHPPVVHYLVCFFLGHVLEMIMTTNFISNLRRGVGGAEEGGKGGGSKRGMGLFHEQTTHLPPRIYLIYTIINLL